MSKTLKYSNVFFPFFLYFVLFVQLIAPLRSQSNTLNKKDKLSINLKAKTGDKVNLIMCNLLQALGKPFLCDINSELKFKKDVFINDITYEEVRDFFIENYDIIFEEIKNKKLLIKSSEGYWNTYQLDFPNYTYKMSSAMIQESNYVQGTNNPHVRYANSRKKKIEKVWKITQ